MRASTRLHSPRWMQSLHATRAASDVDSTPHEARTAAAHDPRYAGEPPRVTPLHAHCSIDASQVRALTREGERLAAELAERDRQLQRLLHTPGRMSMSARRASEQVSPTLGHTIGGDAVMVPRLAVGALIDGLAMGSEEGSERGSSKDGGGSREGGSASSKGRRGGGGALRSKAETRFDSQRPASAQSPGGVTPLGCGITPPVPPSKRGGGQAVAPRPMSAAPSVSDSSVAASQAHRTRHDGDALGSPEVSPADRMARNDTDVGGSGGEDEPRVEGGGGEGSSWAPGGDTWSDDSRGAGSTDRDRPPLAEQGPQAQADANTVAESIEVPSLRALYSDRPSLDSLFDSDEIWTDWEQAAYQAPARIDLDRARGAAVAPSERSWTGAPVVTYTARYPMGGVSQAHDGAGQISEDSSSPRGATRSPHGAGADADGTKGRHVTLVELESARDDARAGGCRPAAAPPLSLGARPRHHLTRPPCPAAHL